MTNDVFMLAADGDAEKAAEMREADKRDYHRQKSAENRDMWATLGVKQVNVSCASGEAGYIRAVAALRTAIRLYDLVEARDASTIDTLCNVRPRYGVSYGEVRQLHTSTENPNTKEACVNIMWALDEARIAKATGYAPDVDPADAPYYLAREFVLARYSKGAYDMLVHRITSKSFGDLPLTISATSAEVASNEV